MENWRIFLQEKKISTPREVRLAILIAKKYAPKGLRSSAYYEKARFIGGAAAKRRNLEGGNWQGAAPWYFIKLLTFQFPDVTLSPDWKKFTTKVGNGSYSFLKKYKSAILQTRELFNDTGSGDAAPQRNEGNTIFINLTLPEDRRLQRMNLLKKAWLNRSGTQALPKGAIDAVNFSKIVELAGTLVHEVAHAEDVSEFNKYVNKIVRDEIMTAVQNNVFKPDKNTTEEDLQVFLEAIYEGARPDALIDAKTRARENYAYRSEIEFYQNLRKWIKSKSVANPKSIKYKMMSGFTEEAIDSAISLMKKIGAPGKNQIGNMTLTPYTRAPGAGGLEL